MVHVTRNLTIDRLEDSMVELLDRTLCFGVIYKELKKRKKLLLEGCNKIRFYIRWAIKTIIRFSRTPTNMLSKPARFDVNKVASAKESENADWGVIRENRGE